MAHYNKIILQGRLGREPELKSTTGDNQKCTFTVASNEYMGADRNDQTHWFNVVAYNSQAKYISEWAHQGDEIVITGRLRADKYQNAQGQEQVYNYIKVEQIINIRAKKQQKEEAYDGTGTQY